MEVLGEVGLMLLVLYLFIRIVYFEDSSKFVYLRSSSFFISSRCSVSVSVSFFYS
jgi:hypothetical protein